MNTFLIIIALVLWVGLKSYKSVRQQMADLENSADAEEPKASTTFVEEERSAGYYSYKTVEEVNVENVPHTEDVSVRQDEAIQAGASDTKDTGNDINFDLRQAVIYQTILNNKYLSEV